MKRFIIDLFLILIIVTIGNSVSESSAMTMTQRIKMFDEQVQNHQLVSAFSQGNSVNQIEENKAGKLGKQISEWVIALTQESVRVITMAFDE